MIEDDFERHGEPEVNPVQALLLFNIADSELTAGRHTLSVEMIGANPKAARKFNMFGLDYVKLEPQ